jgi:arabinogalactan oligomer/maltooligosaccharide transport system substrate-binding protein
MITPNLRRNFILTVSLLAMLIACTPPTPPTLPTPKPTPTPMPVKVTYQIQQTPGIPTATPQTRPAFTSPTTTITVWESLSEAQAQALTEDIQAFQSEFPQYTVTLRHYDSPESFMTPLMVGELNFDVALVSPVLLGNLWTTEQIAPMSDFFPPSFVNDFAGVTLLGASRDGELWGVSDTAGFHLLLFYNQDLVDTPPTTTTELFNLAQELTHQGSQTQGAGPLWGLALNSYDPLWLVPWLAPYGGWLTDEAGQPTLNTPSMEAAITLYLSWQGRLTGIAPVATYEEVHTRFLNGDIAMMIDGEWAIVELARANKINWGVTLLPSVGEAEESQPAAPLVLARYWVISRSATSDRALASATFLEYITRPERQLDWTIRFGLLPTRLTALDDLVVVNDSALRMSAAQMLAGRTVPPGVNADVLLNAMREPLRGVIDGELTPQEAAEMMQVNAER